MAVISKDVQAAEVVGGVGDELSASVSLSAHLMEMLSTIYKYILLAAIREAIQNGCDAARRAGLSFEQGVMVTLPTPDSPTIVVRDQGCGMTQHFMETKYLAFGESTKSGDDGAAGGLGVGRWAAYGYTRECLIQTCCKDDGLLHTYMQYQGEDGKPKTKRAASVPSETYGTTVSIPVKPQDIPEAIRAVSWLKAVMQLTMDDSFAVAQPEILESVAPAYLPAPSGVVLELGAYDPELAGVRVFPMTHNGLLYSRGSVGETGSLVVLTNHEAGIGGLPFHVTHSEPNSVFRYGCVIDIPMRFGVEFMPSREEVKYSDAFVALMAKIDAAALKAVAPIIKEARERPGLQGLHQLARLLGAPDARNVFAFLSSVTEAKPGTTAAEFQEALGRRTWSPVWRAPFVSEARSASVTMRIGMTGDRVIRTLANYPAGVDAVDVLGSRTKNGLVVAVRFFLHYRVRLVVVDVKTGGYERFRHWFLRRPKDANEGYIFISSRTAGEAYLVAKALNARLNNELEVMMVSSLPEVATKIAGTKVIKRSAATALNFWSASHARLETDTVTFTTPSTEKCRVFVTKAGRAFDGMKEGTVLGDILGQGTDFQTFLGWLGAARLWILSPKQTSTLNELRASMEEEGLLELAWEDLGDDEEAEQSWAEIQAVKTWLPLESAIGGVMAGEAMQSVLAGKTYTHRVRSVELERLVGALKKKPRMMLTGTKVDRSLRPFVDVLSGESKLFEAGYEHQAVSTIARALRQVAKVLEPSGEDDAERKELLASLAKLQNTGCIDYAQAWKELHKSYPLLETLANRADLSEAAVEHVVLALTTLYA